VRPPLPAGSRDPWLSCQPPTARALVPVTGAGWVCHTAAHTRTADRFDGRKHPMADIGGMADKAKDVAKDNPEKVDQAKDKAKETLSGKDGDQK
jgi:hypothetical protein